MPNDESADVMLGEAVEPSSRVRLDLRESADEAPTIGDLWKQSLAEDWSVSIQLEGVEVTGAATGFRVFLNEPDADSRTSIDDARYVGSYAFFPLPEGKADVSEEVGGFVVPLKDALIKQGTLNRTDPPDELIVTIVPLGEPDVALGYAGARLRIN